MQTAKTDQIGRMYRLIWVFVDRTDHFVGFVGRRLIYLLDESGQVQKLYIAYFTPINLEYVATSFLLDVSYISVNSLFSALDSHVPTGWWCFYLVQTYGET